MEPGSMKGERLFNTMVLSPAGISALAVRKTWAPCRNMVTSFAVEPIALDCARVIRAQKETTMRAKMNLFNVVYFR